LPGLPHEEINRMPTDRISPASSLLETMRALARERAHGNRPGGRAAGATASVAADPAQVAAATPRAELRQRLRTLASQVNLDDPQAVAAAREPALREILLWEFGADFRQDAQFQATVESIAKALDVEPRFQQQFTDMLKGLR
jgi:hypothetical protein